MFIKKFVNVFKAILRILQSMKIQELLQYQRREKRFTSFYHVTLDIITK